MGDWQSIDTAPQSISVLVWIPSERKERQMSVGHKLSDNLWIVGGTFSFDVGQPTHWMPLPTPPTPAQAGRE